VTRRWWCAAQFTSTPSVQSVTLDMRMAILKDAHSVLL
jgi:hypothetical protein